MCVHRNIREDVELFVQIVVESIDRQFPRRKSGVNKYKIYQKRSKSSTKHPNVALPFLL